MALQFSADGRYLVAGCCDTGASWVQVFDLWDDGRCVVDINAHTKAVYAVAFAPYNPARLLSCSSDHSAKVWECKALQSAEPAPRTLDRGFSFLTREESTGSGTGLRRVPPLPEPQPFEADEEYMCVTALIHTSPVYCAVFHPTAEAVLTGRCDVGVCAVVSCVNHPTERLEWKPAHTTGGRPGPVLVCDPPPPLLSSFER